MTRAHFVKKAMKDNQVCKKGESYYWWKFRFGGKQYSKTEPRQSQLTGSEFLSQMYSFGETIGDLKPENMEELRSEVENMTEEIRALGEECTEKQYNMPDSLQDSETGQLLENRNEECENMASELESIEMEDIDEEELKTEAKDELEGDDPTEKEIQELMEEKKQEKLQEVLEEVQMIEYQGE